MKLLTPNHYPVNRDGLVCWYDYCNSGEVNSSTPVTAWSDYSGNSNHGTLVEAVNAKVYSSGLFCDTIYDYLTCASAPSLNFGTGDCTISFKVKVSGNLTLDGWAHSLVKKTASYQNSTGWMTGVVASTANSFTLSVTNTGHASWTNGSIVTPMTFETGKTYQVTVTRQGLKTKLYVDAVLCISDLTGRLSYNVDNAQPLLVSKYFGGQPSHYKTFTNAIQLYKRCLSDGEIKLNYERNRGNL